MKRFLFLLLLIPTAQAADVNGYTALYECRSGNSNCNVDVATYVTASCDQTVAVATAWASINWSNNVICFENGDHSAKGTLVVGGSGTSGTRKVLRYTRTGDDGDYPWNQTEGNKAIISGISCTSRTYLIFSRLTVYPTSGGRIFLDACNYAILDHMLVDGQDANSGNALIRFDYTSGANTSITLQNSVIRNTGFINNGDAHCINLRGNDTHIVNNEIYNCGGDGIVIDSGSSAKRAIIENNDIYQTSDYQIGCDGTAGTDCNCGEDNIDVKDGTSVISEGTTILHNRFWGSRTTYQTCSGSGSTGRAIAVTNSGTDAYGVHVKNNIITDSANGIQIGPANGKYSSVNGNLIYDVNYRHTPLDVCPGAGAICGEDSIAIFATLSPNTEYYLNTIIGSEYAWSFSSGANQDNKCNKVIDSTFRYGGTAPSGSGTEVAYTTCYGTDECYSNQTPSNNIDNALNVRANSTAYSEGAYIVTTADPVTYCTGTSDKDCFLYKVTTAGTSDSSIPAYTTTLGGTTTDGTMVVKAIASHFPYYRKLLTGAEQKVIPYAKVHNSAPEYNYCPNTTGSRASIGVSDQTGTW